MYNNVTSHLVAAIFYSIDSWCRKQLSLNNITSEDDYVSKLTGFINHPLGPLCRQSIWLTRKLAKSQERLFGCDGLIIFKKYSKIKIGLFEVKWPRIVTHKNYAWDYQQGTKPSHFSDQLQRQHTWSGPAAIWEMFMVEALPGQKISPFSTYASSCVWHDIAHNYMMSNNLVRRVWNNNDLIGLLSSRPPFFARGYGSNLRHIIFAILTCSIGMIMKPDADDRSFLLSSEIDTNMNINIPLFQTEEDRERIIGFMHETGLAYYLLLDLEDVS